jgi:hypothetical protein
MTKKKKSKKRLPISLILKWLIRFIEVPTSIYCRDCLSIECKNSTFTNTSELVFVGDTVAILNNTITSVAAESDVLLVSFTQSCTVSNNVV